MPYIDEIQIGSTSYDIKDKNISITLNGTATTSPSFYAPTTVGEADQVLTSNGSGAPTWMTPAAIQVPNLTLNGATAWNKSFYAPTAAGTADQVLISNGSGAPSWRGERVVASTTTPGSDCLIWIDIS